VAGIGLGLALLDEFVDRPWKKLDRVLTKRKSLARRDAAKATRVNGVFCIAGLYFGCY
jgi:hypothetical protein